MSANELTQRQQAFLYGVGLKIIRLLAVAEQGSRIAYFRLGTRKIGNKLVVMKLVIEDVPDCKPEQPKGAD